MAQHNPIPVFGEEKIPDLYYLTENLHPNFRTNSKHSCLPGRYMNIPNVNSCSISWNLSFIQVLGFRGRICMGKWNWFVQMVNAISERNLPVPNFAYHLPQAWTRFDHVNGKQPFVNRLFPLSKLYALHAVSWNWGYLYTLIYRERNTEGKSRQAQLNYSRKV